MDECLKGGVCLGKGAQRAAGALFFGGGFLDLEGGGFAGGKPNSAHHVCGSFTTSFSTLSFAMLA